MGILRRLLKKKEKPGEGKQPKEPVDPLDLGGGESTPPPLPKAALAGTDLTESDRSVPEPVDHAPPAGRDTSEEVHVPELRPIKTVQEPMDTAVPPLSLREGVHIAEQSLSRVERALVKLGESLSGEEASIARIKILLMEAKIPLAEAGIRIAETEISPTATLQKLTEAEERLSQVESKIIDAERAVILLAVKAQSAPPSLPDVKIGLATAKIRVSQARIQLTGAMFPAIPGETTAQQSPELSHEPIRLPQDEPARIPPPPLSMRTTIREEDPLLPPPAVRITDEPLSPGESAGRDRLLEPVKFQPEKKPGGSENDLKTRVIMGGLDDEESPFDTGISSARVRIADEGDVPPPPVPTTKERMTIRSDERESAWVSADGTLKDSAMARETGASSENGDERSRIAISQPAPQKDIIIEELNRKGIELRQKGKLVDALECFNRVLALDPGNVAALHNRGVALRAEGRFEEALASFERVIEREGNNPLVWFNKGFVLSKLQRHEEAIKAFDRVLALDPGHAASWYNKGKLLALVGRAEEADQHLQKARELGYTGGVPQTQ